MVYVDIFSLLCEGVSRQDRQHTFLHTLCWEDGPPAVRVLAVVLYESRAVRNNRCQQVGKRKEIQERQNERHSPSHKKVLYRRGKKNNNNNKRKRQKAHQGCRGLADTHLADDLNPTRGVGSPMVCVCVCSIHYVSSRRRRHHLYEDTTGIFLDRRAARLYSVELFILTDDMRPNANLRYDQLSRTCSKLNEKIEKKNTRSNEFFSLRKIINYTLVYKYCIYVSI